MTDCHQGQSHSYEQPQKDPVLGFMLCKVLEIIYMCVCVWVGGCLTRSPWLYCTLSLANYVLSFEKEIHSNLVLEVK